jgi:uncharacterized Ntn-hydrolase superfamily protein
MTFSLCGVDATTGMAGTVVASSSPCVAARCAWARAGAGAVASQNITDPSLGPALLDRLEAGETAERAIAAVAGATEFAAYRQLLAVDRAGGAAIWSGPNALGTVGEALGAGCVSAGNLLAQAGVPAAMVGAFEASEGAHLVERLVRALEAGLAAGGEAGPVRSAGLVAVDRVAWPVADLRVDWDDAPVAALRSLWTVWEPQLADYVTRALAPGAAPSFGVPGDD